jgi:predicted ATPase
VGLRDLGIHRLKDLGRPEEVFQLEIEGLDGQFPPLRSLDNPELLHNLPELVSSFVGREAEVAELRRMVEESRLVTLTGPGGVGKTRLALQVAAELLDGSGDGVWLVELAAVRDPEAVAGAVAGALGIKEQSGRSTHDVLVAALAPRDVLVVLDNCEHLIGACAKTAEAILQRCPKVHLIATSREPLGIGGETIYRVPSLSLPTAGDGDEAAAATCDAVAAFAARAGEQGTALPVDEQSLTAVLAFSLAFNPATALAAC